MGKTGTKKKTIWRTLSIGDITPTSNTNGSTKEIKKDYKTSYKIDLTSKPNNNQRNGQLSSTSSELSNNENRNSFNSHNNYNNYSNKYNNDSSNTALPNSTSPSHQQFNKTYLPYKRRPFSSKSLNYNSYYSNNNSSGAGGNYRTNYRYRINNFNNNSDSSNNDSQINKGISSEKKESNFNEDEYTRITTPRQDVLFKKGYLSKPKKYLKYNDSHTPSSSGAMSIISTEESTTTSTQSITPENFNSIPENPDESEFPPYPYQSYFDQNGLYYVNPYNFDPYGGQMFMMPYPTSANYQQPFNTNSFDIYDNSQITTTSTSPVSFNQSNDSNTENNENSSNTEIQITSPEIIKVDEATQHIKEEVSCEIILKEEITLNDKLPEAEGTTPEENASAAEEDKEVKIEENYENTVHDYANDNAPYYQPFMYYPYYFCPPQSMFPGNDLSYTDGFGFPYDNSLGNKYFKYKKRKRKPRKTLNSSGVTTDECSEDESTDNENYHSHHYIPFTATQPCETTKCYLNVEVEEFQPKYYTPKLIDVAEKSSTMENIPSQPKHDDNPKTLQVSDTSSPEISLCANSTPFVPNYSNVLKMESKDINKKTAINNINLNNNSISNKAKKKTNKKSLPKTATIMSSEIINESPSNEPTYAQMLNGVNKTIPKETYSKTEESKLVEVIKNIDTTPVKIMTPIKKVEKWQTVVKSKGKRGKNINIEEADVAPELVNEEQIIEQQLTISHDTNRDDIVLTTSNNQDVLNTSSELSQSTPPKKQPLAKQKSKSKPSKKNPKRKNLQTKLQNGFEVIEPKFEDTISNEPKQHEEINRSLSNLTEFDSFIDEVQDVINLNFNETINLTNNAATINDVNFTNFNFIEADELDKDFDIIEKNITEDEDIETVQELPLEEMNVEQIFEKVYVEQDIIPLVEKRVVIDLDEELKNGCAIENKINGQVEEIIEKITVNEIESICNKIEQELSIDENHVTEEEVETKVILPNFIEENDATNCNIDECTELNILCDTNREETENFLLSNNVKENDAVKNENVYGGENGFSSTNMKFPLTEAVTKWLFEKENQHKTKITEPVLRLPDDPILSSKIQLMILSRSQFYHDDDNTHDDEDEWTTESETELDHDDNAKNFLRNPLPVSSHNSSNEDINNLSIIDTDSDYMSDSQIRADDNTRKRVAATKNYDSDTTITTTTTASINISSNNQSKLNSKSLDNNNSTKTIDKCIKLPFTDVCCVLM